MSHMTHTAPQSAGQRAILSLRTPGKPSGYDIARAYLERNDQHNRCTEAVASSLDAVQERQSAIRRFHHQAFAAQLFSYAGQRAVFLDSALGHKTRQCLQALRAITPVKAYRTDAMRALLPVDLWCMRISYQQQHAPIAAVDEAKANVWWRALQMIVAPNIFLVLGNVLLLMPLVFRTHGISDDMLVQTAQLIKLGCNYLLPLLCGWALVLFALRRPMSALWPLIGLLSLAGNSCWLVIDARIALMGGSLRLCTNVANSSWSWFGVYLAATLPLYLVCSKRLRRAIAARNAGLDENTTPKPLQQRHHDKARQRARLANQSHGFLANRWHW
ncbi:hypothetical protein Brsp05_04544 [Brucella sp. NBRC 12953]|uniref:hypothetical protein n=1 Tax=Brucella sp. NBRC 12953 TaxID=3075481 RepID=UPI003094CDC2